MTLVPAASFVAPVKDVADLYSFVIPMEAKALTDGDTVTVEENGDLILEGYAAVWEGEDRQGENFAPGAFERATKAFLDAGGPICFHHKQDHVLGKTLELEEDGKGLRFKGRVDSELQKNPTLGTIYHQIKKGTLKGLSVGGFFKRALIEGKQRIADMDFTEISVTGVPMHTGPSFAVVAGKALVDDVQKGDHVSLSGLPAGDEEIREDDLWMLNESIGSIERIIEHISGRKTNPENAL